ncbi:MAG TPA: methyltransferase [Gemmatimonas sp.]|nr:methyltransferase [Gemmatimonas sp.]
MTTRPQAPAALDYYTWQQDTVRVGKRSYRLGTKPGMFAHRQVDSASVMIAEHARVAVGDVAVYLNCGNGLFGAVALAAGASRVVMADRNILSYEAAQRTLAVAIAGANADIEGRGEAYLSHGASSLPRSLSANVVAIRVPHERVAMLQLLSDAFGMLQEGGTLVVGGAVKEGIRPAVRAMEAVFGNAKSLAQGGGHHVAQAVKRSATPVDPIALASPMLDPNHFHEVPVTLRGLHLSLHTRPGVFSWEHADDATALLAEVMQLEQGQSVLDIGCGAGALGTVAGLVTGTPVCMVDADSEAVRCATRTAQSAGVRARVLASDIASALGDERFDVVVCNPPFHVGKSTDLEVPAQFIRDAYRVLAPGGSVQIVANRTLPYERLVEGAFGHVRTLHDGPRFKVLTAVKRTA